MCGLTGFWQPDATADDLAPLARAMADRIAHRGPDDHGEWADAETGIVLAHRRLSILDLSPAGHQPMVSASGRWVIAYNGEVYNHLALRTQLEAACAAPAWRGHSDTETLLACIEAWGVEDTLKRSVGMFAIALWDRARRELWLVRDRLGEKPLYYGWQGDTFLFGSELKALRAHPSFNASVNRGALALLLRHNYVPDPHSIWQGINKLLPGTWLKLHQRERDPRPVAYWSLAEVAERGAANPFQGSDAEALSALERVLGDAVQGQMVADVPLGALLSGGIDSTLVTALMQARSSRPVRTFTIGFEDKKHDESVHARAVAAHLGTDHTALQLSPRDALDLIPQLPQMYDEPFADSSQLPTHLVMKLVRQHVTVALSGDGGDEFFGGYNRYFLAPKIWSRIGWMSTPVRRVVGFGLMAASAPALNSRFRMPERVLGIGRPLDRAFKLGQRLRQVRSIDDVYASLVSEWPNAGTLVVNCDEVPPNLLDDRERWPRLANPVARMMAVDALTYLPGDIMAKVDRASMAASLETRAPFLDREVVEFAWSLPMQNKIRNGRGKWLLRQLLDRYVPRTLIERPKQGFGIPLDEWLRGPLRDWAEDLLSEDRLRGDGFFRPSVVRQTWGRHLRRNGSYGYRLWSILMFQAWLQAERGAVAAADDA